MSFGKTRDATRIAHVIGRAVRDPPARSVHTEESLDPVALFPQGITTSGCHSVGNRLSDPNTNLPWSPLDNVTGRGAHRRRGR